MSKFEISYLNSELRNSCFNGENSNLESLFDSKVTQKNCHFQIYWHNSPTCNLCLMFEKMLWFHESSMRFLTTLSSFRFFFATAFVVLPWTEGNQTAGFCKIKWTIFKWFCFNSQKLKIKENDWFFIQNRNRNALPNIYPSPTYIKYNQKVAAAGMTQLAEPTLPFLFKSVMFK